MTDRPGRGGSDANAHTDAILPPHNLDAEEYVLGALMLGDAPTGIVERVQAIGLRVEHFYRETHGSIYLAELDLHSQGEPVDPITVANRLREFGRLSDVGGIERIRELATIVPAATNAPHHARIVVELAHRREQFNLAHELERASLNGGLHGHPELVERVGRLLTSDGAGSQVRTFAELLEQYQAERSAEDAKPVRLGFGSIDADIRGVSAGQVLGVAARTAVGKTWVLNSVLEQFAVRKDAGALVLSLELPGPEWAERQLAVHADVAPEQVEAWAREGVLLEFAKPFLERMRNVVAVDDPVQLTDLRRVFAAARRQLSAPLRLVTIDYLGLLTAEGKDAYQRASAIGLGLKLVAKQEQVAVVVAMQLSRAGGDGSTPVTIEMLRDSGVLEESLDFLLGCWRPEKAQNLGAMEAEDVRDLMRVAILKNRKGSDGRVVDLRFHRASRRLYEPAREFA